VHVCVEPVVAGAQIQKYKISCKIDLRGWIQL